MGQTQQPASVTTQPHPGWVRSLAPPKVRAYARLAKLDMFDYYLGVLVALTLLPPAERLGARTLATLALFLLGEVCVVAATVSFDDITGYRDGSDRTNYGPDAPLRRLVRKPLLAGTLSEPEAVRFGWIMGAVGTLLWGAAIAVAPHASAWSVALVAACLVAALQYSYGLKLSYYGLQEFVIWGFGVGAVLAPYGLISDGPLGFATVQAVLFGMGMVLIGVYSNTNDVQGDAAVGRPTVAVKVSPRANAAFIGALSLAETLLIVGSALLRVAPWWFPLVMLPVIALRTRQYTLGFGQGDILAARLLGIRTHRVAATLLIGVNLLVPLVGGAP